MSISVQTPESSPVPLTRINDWPSESTSSTTVCWVCRRSSFCALRSDSKRASGPVFSCRRRHPSSTPPNMASTRNPLENLILTPHQQQLLFAALNSNRPSSRPNSAMFQTPLNSMSMPGVDGLGTFQTNPGFSFDYDFAHDTSFGFSFDDSTQHTATITAPAPPASKAPSKPESTENDSSEKRSRPDDGEGDSAAKRRESQEKVHKKPGRKPLTDEPSSVSRSVKRRL